MVAATAAAAAGSCTGGGGGDGGGGGGSISIGKHIKALTADANVVRQLARVRLDKRHPGVPDTDVTLGVAQLLTGG